MAFKINVVLLIASLVNCECIGTMSEMSLLPSGIKRQCYVRTCNLPVHKYHNIITSTVSFRALKNNEQYNFV
jgi:hypothetical protein